MAKEKGNGYTLICPGCERQSSSPFKAAICPDCGQVAVPPGGLADGAFENAAEGEVVIAATKPEKKPASDTRNRSAEDGGGTF